MQAARAPASLVTPPPSCPRQLPVELVLLLTVPVVDPDKEDGNWKRPLNCLHLVTSPLVVALTLQSGVCEYPALGRLPLPHIPGLSSQQGVGPAAESWTYSRHLIYACAVRDPTQMLRGSSTAGSGWRLPPGGHGQPSARWPAFTYSGVLYQNAEGWIRGPTSEGRAGWRGEGRPRPGASAILISAVASAAHWGPGWGI